MTDASTGGRVRWGVLGTAKIATKVGKAIQKAAGSELFAIASRDFKKAEAWAKEHAVPHAVGSYEELLASPDIDAIYIPLPTSMHAEWTIKAAEQGKHVLCEKPLAMSMDEAREMASACQANNVQLMDGIMWVHHARAAAMRKVLQAEELGTLRRVTSAFTFQGRTMPAENIRLNRALGGGALGDLGWYCTRGILFAFGEMPLRVFATARYEQEVEISLSAILWFSDNRMASFDCGFETTFRNWIEIAGTDASLVCDDFVLPWSDEEARFWIHGEEGKKSQEAIKGCVQEVQMIEDFCAIVSSGTPDYRWTQAALQTQLVVDAIDRSARSGRVLDVPFE